MLLHEAKASARPSEGAQQLFIGTSSQSEFAGHGEGIFLATLRDGRLSTPQLLAKAISPSFLAVPSTLR